MSSITHKKNIRLSAFIPVEDVILTTVSTTLIVFNNNSRVRTLITAAVANASAARLGNSSISNTKGYVLNPGETLDTGVTQSIYVKGAVGLKFHVIYEQQF